MTKPTAKPHSAASTADYHRHTLRKYVVLLAAFLLLCLCFLGSLKAGSAEMSMGDVLRALLQPSGERDSLIVWNIRLPRACIAVTVGMCLAMCGAIMQNVLRNPLASSSTLGVSQGAAFGAAVAIVYFGAGAQVNNVSGDAAVSISNPTLVTAFAFLGGMGTTVVIMFISRALNAGPAVLVLAGVALSAMFSAGTSLVQYFADDIKVASVVYWTFGSLGRASWIQIFFTAGIAGAAFIYFMYNRWNYNAFEAGADTAKSLGVPVAILVPTSLLVCALIAAVSVAFVGVISFIGLVASHIMRRLLGNDMRFLLPGTALCGATLLLLADIAARTIISPVVLPIGAVTSIVGAPIFLFLLLKQRARA